MIDKSIKDRIIYKLSGVIPIGSLIDFEVSKPTPNWGSLVKNWSWHTGVVIDISEDKQLITIQEEVATIPLIDGPQLTRKVYPMNIIKVININHHRVNS